MTFINSVHDLYIHAFQRSRLIQHRYRSTDAVQQVLHGATQHLAHVGGHTNTNFVNIQTAVATNNFVAVKQLHDCIRNDGGPVGVLVLLGQQKQLETS